MKVVIGATLLGEGFIDRLAGLFPEVTFVAAYSSDAQRREIGDADVFLGWPDQESVKRARSLRWIHAPGMGIDRLALIPEIADSTIVLTNSPGSHTNPMADHVMAVILALAHNLSALIDDRRARRWDTAKYAERMVELNGAVMGILSIGGIGRAVAQRAAAFGMRICAVDPGPTDVPAGIIDVWGLDRLDEVLGLSDWFVVTSPLTPETRGIIDARRIGLMKPGASLIVVSRGGIVDEAALAAALQSGRLAGAALDATAVEPPPPESPLWGLENVILSPHASALSPQLYEGRRRVFIGNLRRFLEGKPLAFVCDLRRGY